MATKFQQQIAAMRLMSIKQLQDKYVELFGQLPRTCHKGHLLSRIVWQAQAAAEGGLSVRAKRRAAELAKNADLSVAGVRKPPTTKRDKRLPMWGTVLVRPYRGRMIEVRVMEHGFEHNGQRYKTLTAVTAKITGKHWNGFHFFGLQKEDHRDDQKG